tara:strand:- start:2781 stop:4085 length:1305 start_codon:yes stop_codon:yes gene_type:complete
MKKITTIILVAGKSSRFKGRKSKIFHELAGLTIIEHIYNKAKKISNNDIIFVCNKDNIKILKKMFSNCKFALQKNQKGTADAVLSAKNFLKKNSNILILFGDVPLVNLNTLIKLKNNFFKNKLHGSMLAFNAKNPFAYGRVLTLKNKVISVVEELNATNEIRKISLCNAGILICKYSLLFSYIKKIDNKNIKKEKYLPDIFNISHQNNQSFNYILCDENEMLGVNTLNDFNKIDKIYQELLINKLIKKGVSIIDPSTVRVSYDTIIGKNSIIEPFVIIAKGVKIGSQVIIKSYSNIDSSHIGNSCSIGPYARLRPFSKIDEKSKIGNFVEIKNSKIGKNTSISHLSYIGDSSLGRNVNIGAGTITCNFDGKNKHKTIIENNVFVGSNCSLVAPIKIKRNSKIGAGSVITKDIPSNSLALTRPKLIIKKKINKNR